MKHCVESVQLFPGELLFFRSPPERRHEVVENDGLIGHVVDLFQPKNALLQVPAYMTRHSHRAGLSSVHRRTHHIGGPTTRQT